MKFLKKLLFPVAACAAVFGGMPAEAQAKPLSPREQLAELRSIGERLSKAAEARNKVGEMQVSQPVQAPVQQVPPAIPFAPQEQMVSVPVGKPPQQEPVFTTPSPDLVRPEGALPQQQAGEKWQPIRGHAEGRARPNDVTIEAKAEVVTRNGWMFGVQHVNSSGTFSGSNATDVFKGEYTDTRSEFWAGRHWASQDGLTRWSVNGFVRQLTHIDSGEGKSRPGAEYPYTYKWKNTPTPLTQIGVRARIERDLIQTESQQLTVHLKGEAAATVAGESGWAYDVQAGVWYRTAQVEAYAEAGVNNTGGYANGYGRYYLTKGGQLKPFVEVRGEVGSGYHNTQVGGGVQVGIGRNAYAEGVLGYNAGTSGNGMAATARFGFRF